MATKSETQVVAEIGADYKYGFHDDARTTSSSPAAGSRTRSSRRSRSTRTSRTGCASSGCKALDYFMARPLPTLGRRHDAGSTSTTSSTTSARPRSRRPRGRTCRPDIKNTCDRLGIPEAERKFLAGVGAQYESEVVYHKLQEDLEEKGVIFLDMDSGLREHEELVKQYFGTIIPPNDNKFAALNSAVWSGGSFIYVPPGV